MYQRVAISSFFSALLIANTIPQTCCPPSTSSSARESSINIVFPVGGYGLGGPGGLAGYGLGGIADLLGYYGYFTRYLGPANATGFCPAGVNINGLCWYNSIGNTKR